MDSLKICPSSDGLTPVSPCSHCFSFEHVELDCPVMTIQGQFPFRQDPTSYLGLSQAGRSHYPNQGNSSYPNSSYVK